MKINIEINKELSDINGRYYSTTYLFSLEKYVMFHSAVYDTVEKKLYSSAARHNCIARYESEMYSELGVYECDIEHIFSEIILECFTEEYLTELAEKAVIDSLL